MNPFAHFERLATRIFEEDLPRALGGRLDPAELCRSIDRALDAEDVPPSALRVEVDSETYVRLQDRRAAIEAELGSYAGARMGERWPAGLGRKVLVRLATDASLAHRDIRTVIIDAPDATGALTMVMKAPAASVADVPAAQLWNEGNPLPVQRLPLTIGRALDNDIVLDDTSVSRYHAQIRAAGRRLVLVDLESTNGSFVNGKRIAAEAKLRDGDEIRLGRCPLRLSLGRAKNP